MKKLLAIILSLCAVFLVSCSRTVKMSFAEDGTLTGGGASYKFAPVGYEPTYQGEEYAVIKGTLEEKLYKIGDCDPKKWLATEYSGAATLVYYSTDITLPTLQEMEPTLCFICEQEANAFSVYTVGENEETREHDLQVISQLVEMLKDGDENEIWPRSDVNYTYNLKFYSPDWEAIYYNVVYAVCGGGNFLYDRVTGNCVNAGSLLEEYYESIYTEENDS